MTEENTGGQTPQGTNPNPNPTPDPDPAPSPNPPPDPPAGQGEGQGRQQGGDGQKPETFDRQYVESLRRENASYRTKANELENQFNTFRSGIAKALGIEQEEPDPKTLQQQLDAERNQTRRFRLQNTVLTNSLRQGADPELMWAHLYASGTLEDIDLSSADANQQIAAAVEQAMGINPKLKADFQGQPQQGQPPPNVGGGSNPAPPTDDGLPERNPFSKEHWNLTEQGRLVSADPMLADRLRKAAVK
jgi:hypothetical protein